jgi:signal transduction histidine kinase
MKLVTKYNRASLIATLIAFLFGAIGYYIVIRSVLIQQLDEDLQVEESEISDFVKAYKHLPVPDNYKDEHEEFLPVNSPVKRKFSVIKVYSKSEDENVPYRQLSFPLVAEGRNYQMIIRRSLQETEDLISLILTITLIMILILALSLVIVNRFVLNKLWKPFNSTIQQMKKFNLQGMEKIEFENNDINEFRDLDEAVKVMAARAGRDYSEIRDFTENASHEIQTPLAIIKSKLELLSQSDLNEEQMDIIQSVYEATGRLSRLNQSLILLTKIDNRQFGESEKVDISRILNNYLSNFEELIAAKLITVKKEIDENVILNMNESLAEIMISNLVTNAVRHNMENGNIDIRLTADRFLISNSGHPLQSEPGSLFERFKKDKNSSESLGLGLSIVKKICERYGYNIVYQNNGSLHTTTLTF